MDSICDVINQHAIPKVLELNGMDTTRPPKFEHGDIEGENLEELSNFVARLMSVGALTPDPETEQHLRGVGRLPVTGLEIDKREWEDYLKRSDQLREEIKKRE